MRPLWLCLAALVLVSAAFAQVPASDHVFIVVEENHSYDSVIGNPAMPFLNALANQYGLATNYYANTHPSQPNYFVLTTGQAIIPGPDTVPGSITDDNIVRAILAAGKTWRAYADSLPSPGYVGGDTPPYVRRHNPFAFFSDVNDGGPQQNNIVPFTQFATDIVTAQVANYSFVIPSLLNDAHECAPKAKTKGCDSVGRLAMADQWLNTNLTPLLQSPYFQPGGDGLLIVLFDESFFNDVLFGGGHVAAVVVGPNVVPGTRSVVFHQHQDLLRLCVDALGLTDAPGLAASALDMSEFFPASGPAGGGTGNGPGPIDQKGNSTDLPASSGLVPK